MFRLPELQFKKKKMPEWASLLNQFRSVQFSSVAQSSPTLHDPMDCSTPGLPVHHHLPKFTQTHVHWVSDAIQPFHLLLSLLLPPSIFPSIRVFSNESALHIHRLIKLRVKLGYHYFFIKFLKWLLFAIRIERAMAMGWTESTDMCRIFLALSCYVL